MSNLKTYQVQRVDISWVFVEAESPEEAIEIAHNGHYNDQWEFEIGTPEAVEDY